MVTARSACWSGKPSRPSATSRATRPDPSRASILNHDGFIDRAELDAYFAKRFAKLDKNGDGVLTADEMPGHKSAPKPEQ
ncbi:hypothetical protein ACVDG5_031285 [Mesorhizobium sp. ORM6]